MKILTLSPGTRWPFHFVATLLAAISLTAAPMARGAAYFVTSFGDTGAGSGGNGDLRYCIAQANANPGADQIS